MADVNSKETPNAVSESVSLKFDCSFSKKSLKNNILTMWIFIAPTIVICCYLCIVSGVWFGLIILLIPIAVIGFGMVYLRRMAEESYLEITPDNILKCKYKGHRVVSFPIKEIKTIKEATLKQAEEEYSRFPVILNTKGEEIFSEKGVLITFSRSWIKSVFPIYFNPEDIEGFIAAIRQRMKI